MTPYPLQPFTQFLNNAFRRVVQAWAARLNRARHIAELRAMNERDLSDLGICRADIEAVVSTGAMRDDTRRARGSTTVGRTCEDKAWSTCSQSSV